MSFLSRWTNHLLLTGDIQRQLRQSDAKAIFGTPKTFSAIKKAIEVAEKDIKIICVKTDENETIPDGAIDFDELIDTTSKFSISFNSHAI